MMKKNKNKKKLFDSFSLGFRCLINDATESGTKNWLLLSLCFPFTKMRNFIYLRK